MRRENAWKKLVFAENKTFRLLRYRCGTAVRALEWDPSGRLLAAGLHSGRLEVFIVEKIYKIRREGNNIAFLERCRGVPW